MSSIFVRGNHCRMALLSMIGLALIVAGCASPRTLRFIPSELGERVAVANASGIFLEHSSAESVARIKPDFATFVSKGDAVRDIEDWRPYWFFQTDLYKDSVFTPIQVNDRLFFDSYINTLEAKERKWSAGFVRGNSRYFVSHLMLCPPEAASHLQCAIIGEASYRTSKNGHDHMLKLADLRGYGVVPEATYQAKHLALDEHIKAQRAAKIAESERIQAERDKEAAKQAPILAAQRADYERRRKDYLLKVDRHIKASPRGTVLKCIQDSHLPAMECAFPFVKVGDTAYLRMEEILKERWSIASQTSIPVETWGGGTFLRTAYFFRKD